ncbi:MAG: DUF87 domain-containing protein [Acidobacteriota bacterium]|nr:DUF87 domain-containing protein [Acidobacteriota bacterium]
MFKRLRPLYGTKIDQLWLEYQLADQDRRLEIDQLLTILAVKRLGIGLGDERIVLEPPPESLIGDGDYLLGAVSYPGLAPRPFRVRRNELLRHVFLLGPTGTGKSTFILGLLQQLLEDGKPFMAFDFKRNYRCLLHARAKHAMVVITVGRNVAPLTINALQPPEGVPFPEWAEALADIISTAYLLMQGARNVLKEGLLKAHESLGEKATLRQAYEILVSDLASARSGSRRYGWLESSVRSLDELSKGSFGTALNAIGGTTVREFLDVAVVFELQGLGDDQKRFFCLLLLQGILLVRKNEHRSREHFQHALVFDESHNVFPKEQYGELGIASRLAREVREYGEAIIAATQQADVAESLIANAGFKIILRCDYPKDVGFASRLMQLEEKWFPKLQLGSGIARLPVRYYNPFLFAFAEQPIKNELVDDTEVRARWETSALAVSLAGVAPAAVVLSLSDSERELLLDVADQPISYITQRYERLGWSARHGNATKDALLAKGLATFENVSTPTARIKILWLTPKAHKFLEEHGIAFPHERHGGATHEYWRQTVRSRLERLGFEVAAEISVGGGRTVDLAATRPGKTVYVEIETGRSDIPKNIDKCRDLNAEVVFFFTTKALAAAHAPALAAFHATALTPDTLTLLDRFC